MYNIVVVGLGYVGLNLALLIENSLKKQKIIFNITGFDINSDRVTEIP